MTHAPQLCLGTVQFGLPYGITNQVGQVPEAEVRRILDLAAASGISLLDTAQAYGTAETVLGRCWPTDAPRRLISKLPAGAPRQSWEDSLITSLQRLQASKLDGFLLHRASDLLAPDGEALLDWLEGLRERGLVERIGVSIYDASELEGLPLDRLQLVQLPLSVYDQRLIRDGTDDRLQDLGIAVHVRSVLLQGLLLQSPHYWPDHLSPAFRVHHARWLEHLHQEGLSPLAGALGFVRACEGVEAVLVGVVAGQELAQVLEAWSQAEASLSEAPQDWAWENERDLDPRRWPPR
jgi:aryl-alcohol dehydrogenase-like predicted oxidoreductase